MADTSSDKNSNDPTWYIDQQVKHYEGLASAMRADSVRALKRAADADEYAEKYRRALELLRAAGL